MFDVAQFDGILKKIVEFNNGLLADSVGSSIILLATKHVLSLDVNLIVVVLALLYPFSLIISFPSLKNKKNYALPEIEVSRLGALVKILKDTSHYHSTKFTDADVALLLNLLRSWPCELLFPGKCDFSDFCALLFHSFT